MLEANWQINLLIVIYLLTVIPLWVVFLKQMKLIRYFKDKKNGLQHYRKALAMVVLLKLIDACFALLCFVVYVFFPFKFVEVSILVVTFITVKMFGIVRAWIFYYLYSEADWIEKARIVVKTKVSKIFGKTKG